MYEVKSHLCFQNAGVMYSALLGPVCKNVKVRLHVNVTECQTVRETDLIGSQKHLIIINDLYWRVAG